MKIIEIPVLSSSAVEAQSVVNDPLLAETKMFSKAYQQNDLRLLGQAENYANFNAQTTLLEAVLPEHISFSQQKYTNNGFQAFGELLIPMLERGIAAISLQAQNDFKGNGYAMERQRRQCELAEQLTLEQMAREGLLDNYYVLTVSPYPRDMNKKIAQELGYLPEEQVGKLRLHDFDSNSQNKTIVNFSFSENNQNLEELLNQLTVIITQNNGEVRPLESSLPLINCYLLPKQVGSWSIVHQELAGCLYGSKNKQLLSRSNETINQAEFMAKELVNLDKELAISLLTNKPTQYIQDIVNKLIDSSSFSNQLFTPNDQFLLRGISDNFFNDELARLIKKVALSNSYIKLAVFTKQPKTAHFSLPRDTKSGIFDPSLAQIAHQLFTPMTMSFCGMGFELYNNSVFYGYNPDLIRGYLLPSSKATKVTSCPKCGKSWLVNLEHGTYGIKCSCGNKVKGGDGAKCIVTASKQAQSYQKLTLKEAEFADSRETWD